MFCKRTGGAHAVRTLLLCAGLALAGTAYAQHGEHGGHGGHDGEHRHGPGRVWHGGDIRRFHEHDLQRWSEGRWYHGRHGGHLGWWWIIGPAWYFYLTPVYPYPDPYVPSAVLVPTPVAPATAPGPAAWYYCDDPSGYYPYVARCRTQWRAIVPGAPDVP